MSEDVAVNCLILSDTHGKISNICESIDRFLRVVPKDEPKKLIFLGDKVEDILNAKKLDEFSLLLVKGNCDFGYIYDNFGNEINETEILYIKDKKVLLTHGHRFSAKSGDLLLINEAIKKECDIVLFGHTHTKRNEFYKAGTFQSQNKDIYLFNPGSLGRPNFDKPSFGTLTIKGGNVILSHAEI